MTGCGRPQALATSATVRRASLGSAAAASPSMRRSAGRPGSDIHTRLRLQLRAEQQVIRPLSNADTTTLRRNNMAQFSSAGTNTDLHLGYWRDWRLATSSARA